MRKLQDQAVVVDRRVLGEADWIVVLLCRRLGKLSAVAPSARRSRRRFGGCLELFSRIDVSLTDKGRGGLWRLEEALLVDDHAGLRSDLIAIAHAGYLTELTSALLREGEEVERAFDLLVGVLGALDAGPVGTADLRRYELQMLDAVGLSPVFGACTSCGVPEASAWHFDPDAGGICCPDCAKGPWSQSLPTESLDLLRSLSSGQPVPTPAAAAMADVRALLARIIDHHVGRPLKARRFLRQLAAESEKSE